MLSYYLLHWLIDLVSCFSILIFIFILKLILSASNQVNYSAKELSEQFMSLLNDGQSSLLVITYCLTVIRSIFTLDYIPYFREILIIVLILIIIYNFIFYVLVKEVGFMHIEKVTCCVSLGFLLLSILGSLIYTVCQAFV